MSDLPNLELVCKGLKIVYETIGLNEKDKKIHQLQNEIKSSNPTFWMDNYCCMCRKLIGHNNINHHAEIFTKMILLIQTSQRMTIPSPFVTTALFNLFDFYYVLKLKKKIIKLISTIVNIYICQIYPICNLFVRL